MVSVSRHTHICILYPKRTKESASRILKRGKEPWRLVKPVIVKNEVKIYKHKFFDLYPFHTPPFPFRRKSWTYTAIILFLNCAESVGKGIKDQ